MRITRTSIDTTQIALDQEWRRKQKQFLDDHSHIKIKCVYFKSSGKYYSDGCEWFEKTLFDKCVYPSEYGKRLLELGKLPGLNSGIWQDGFLTVKVQGMYTELVVCPVIFANKGNFENGN